MVRESGDKITWRGEAVKPVGRFWKLGQIKVEWFFEILANRMLENRGSLLSAAAAGQEFHGIVEGIGILQEGHTDLPATRREQRELRKCYECPKQFDGMEAHGGWCGLNTEPSPLLNRQRGCRRNFLHGLRMDLPGRGCQELVVGTKETKGTERTERLGGDARLGSRRLRQQSDFDLFDA